MYKYILKIALKVYLKMMGLLSGIKLFYFIFYLERLSKYIKITPCWLSLVFSPRTWQTVVSDPLFISHYFFITLNFNLSFIKDFISANQIDAFYSSGVILGFSSMHWKFSLDYIHCLWTYTLERNSRQKLFKFKFFISTGIDWVLKLNVHSICISCM